MPIKGFASDNNAGVSPEVLSMMAEINTGHTISYGDDEYTLQAVELFKQQFGRNIEVFFVFSGTGANVLSLAAANEPFNSVLCSSSAHINVDECGAPERFTGCKLISIPTPDGKLNPSLIREYITGFGFEHHSQPATISISQPTEMGTVYTLSEIKDIADLAHENGMILHMDGARLANAAVALNVNLKEITADVGVDILSFGGTKNGLMFAESVIFFNIQLSLNFKFLRKQAMQLTSKMRFISAQFIAYFNNELWKINALHANQMAQKLLNKIKDIPEIWITQKVETNGIFLQLPKAIIKELQANYFFYVWNEFTNEVRWMTSFDTNDEDINGFVLKLKHLIAKEYH